MAGFFLVGLSFIGCGSSNDTPNGSGNQPECSSNGDCPGGRPYCAGGLCVECTGNGNCNGGQVCDGTTGQCKTSCTSTGDCSQPTPYCADRGVCVRCLSDQNCQNAPGSADLCNTAIDRCVQCVSNSQCSGSTPICAVQDGRCHECGVNADCPSGQACTDFHCVPGACTQDSQCGGLRPYCDVAQSLCVQCLTDTNCGQGRTCDTATGTCHFG